MHHLYRSCLLLSIMLLLGCQENVKQQIPETPRFDQAYYEYALASLDETIEDEPKNVEAYRRKADMLLQQGRSDEAISTVRKAIALDRKLPALHVTYAKALLLKGQYPEALQQAREGHQDGAASLEMYEALAEACFYNQQLEDALKYSDSALYLAPKNYRNYLRKGMVQASREDTVAAENNLLKSLELGAPPAEAYGALVTLYLSADNFLKARHFLEKSFAAQEPDEPMRLLQAEIFRHTGDADSARTILYQLKESKKLPAVKVYKELEAWYFQQRTYDSAMYYGNEVLNLQPAEKQTLLTQARIHDRRKNYQSALQTYEKIAALDSTQQQEVHKIAVEELDQLKRKVAYLWKKQQQDELQRLQQNIAPLPAINPGNE